MIRLFEKTATIWTSQGLGEIGATRCLVTEERNGMYECEMDVPITDKHYADIALGCLVLVKPNPYEIAQPFRIYQISRPMNGLVTINAAHLSYDLSKIADQPFTASSVTETMVRLANNAVGSCPFTFQTDKSVTGTFTVSTPRSIRSLLAGSQGSVLDVYGTGEWKFDGYTCYLYLNRGQDRGVVIRYGKNLTDLKQEENNASVYSKLYPYWTDSEGHLVTLPEKTLDINTAGNGTLVYDMSNSFEAQPTEQQLRTAAQSYIDRNSLGTPTVNLNLSFVQISELIKDAIYLCDTVSVEFPALNVSAQAKVIKTVYDALLDRYDSIEVGTVKQTFAQTIATLQDNSITGPVGQTMLRESIGRATAQITGQNGGFYVENDTNGDGLYDEVLFLNTLDISTATNVWRWNLGGLGHSSSGYDGPYDTAITADGHVVADFVDTGTLNANIVKAGILQDAAGINSWNMETGELNLNVTGAVQSITTYYAESDTNSAPRWDLSTDLLTYAGEQIQTYAGTDILVTPVWSTTVPTTSSPNYRWMRNYIVYKDGTSEVTSAAPMQDYYGRANLVVKAGTDGDGNPIGILSGLADYMRFDAGQLEINSPQFTLDRNGNADFSGNLSAATGTFRGSVTAESITLVGGAEIDVNRVTGFADAAQDVVEGTVTAGYVNALNVVAGSVAAENITGSTISGKRIQGGIIYYDANNYWNLQTGEIRISSFANQFSSLTSAVSSAQADIDALEVGIAVDNNGVTVGRQNAAVKGVFSNDSLEFQTMDGTPIAWLSSDASDGLGVDLIQIGSHTTVSQRWIVKTDQNGDRLTFTRRAS